MKRILIRTGLACAFGLSILLTACNKDDDNQTTVNFSAENAVLAAKTDATVDGTLNILENGYEEGENGRSPIVSLFPECTVITINSNGNGGTITLDFGTSCELNNGAIVSGVILMEYGAIVEGTRTIDYSFQDFTYNGNGVTGGGEILREISNSNGNPSSTVNETIVVSFPNTAVTATRTGLRIAEWVEGIGSGTWLDNVYHINGNWNTTFSNGFERNGEVVETLVRKLNCLYFVSGIIEVTQDGFTGSLDYGPGTCDNNAVVNINGTDYPIFL